MVMYNNEEHNKIRMTQFDLNYDLAYTQKEKNKDITESGSSGTIRMRRDKNHLHQQAYMQYLDTLLDLMVVAPGVQSIYNKPEYLFFGPDQSTA